MTTQDTIAALLERELQALERELGLFPDDESVWRTLPGVANAAGNLALHVAGNIQHFVGGVLGSSGYARDREREFNARAGTRAEIVEQLRQASADVRRVVPALTTDLLDARYPEAVVPGRAIQTERFLLHLCVHASFHLGQVGYLRRALTGRNESAMPIPLAALTEPA